MEKRIPTRLSSAEGRKFGFTVGAAFLVFTAFVWWRGHETLQLVFGALAGFFLLGGLIAPRYMGPVERAWMGLAIAISKVTTPIFMGIIYFLVITPIALLMRALGKNPMVHKPIDSPNGKTYFAKRDASVHGDLTQQF